MAVAAFTIGSVGDVALVLELLSQLRTALSSATGTSAEIRQLADDVAGFAAELQRVSVFVTSRSHSLRPDVLNGVILALGSCYTVLRRMQEKVRYVQGRITRAVGQRVWRDYWSVAAWSILGGKHEVDALRLRLSEQLRVIQTYLALSQCKDDAKLREMTRSRGQKLNRIMAVMRDIDDLLDTGMPSFQFYDAASDIYYRPCARTSLQRFQNLYHAYSGQSFEIDVEALDGDGEYRRIWLKPREVDFMRPPLALDCLFFRERAFGEAQVLLGLGSARGNTQAGSTLRLLVSRKHAIGARCNCDGKACGERYLPHPTLCALWTECAECYTELAEAIMATIASPCSSGADPAAFQSLSRGLFQFPEPHYIRAKILPLLNATASSPVDEVMILLQEAPKLAEQPTFPRGLLWPNKTGGLTFTFTDLHGLFVEFI